MRISFDLDETIISRKIDWEVEPDLEGFRGAKERLRKGTVLERESKGVYK